MEDWTGLAFPKLPPLGWLEPLIKSRRRLQARRAGSQARLGSDPRSDERPASRPPAS